MIVQAIAPSRISIFGGGTDVPAYAEIWGGLCLNMAVNIRHKVVIGRDNKLTKEDNPDFFKSFTDLPVEHEYDNSIEGGLGSSAGLAVAVTGALARLKGENFNPGEIAERAWDIEVNKFKIFGGRQDQYSSAFGGVNVMEFKKDEVNVTPLSREFIEPLLSHLVLFKTGIKRKNTKIQEGLRNLTDEQVFHLTMIKNMALQGIEAIANKEIPKVAELMKQAWDSKKLSNKGVTNEEIDKIYSSGITEGALSGKLCGSGGGGHILFLVEPEKRENFIKAMAKVGLRYVDFSIDWNGLETRIL